ncbi:beta-propeller domain-containing protein [Sorangium sp. So ce1182]|uniref:beta-propeller domain-containing protein n=1 Tax=Sorangium sp. So ce1182 TaxID=3133334 RepID=UPI003F5F5566
MPPALFDLTFHRRERATQPEAFRFEPQVYLRLEGDRPVAEAELPWSQDLLQLLGRLARDAGDAGDAEARMRVGAVLRDVLVKLGWQIPEVRRRGGAADEDDGPALLTVRSSAAELYALPWELTTVPASGEHLADLGQLLVRYEWPGLPPLPLSLAAASAEAAPERLLFAWSTAGGWVPADEHRAALAAAIVRSRRPGVRLEVVPDVGQRALENALAADTPTVLHLLCHGTLHEAGGGRSGALDWNDDSGSGAAIDGHRLARLLEPRRDRLRLVVLCACHSGDGDPNGLFLGSVAQALHRMGIPAVVGSRYPLSTDGSLRLTRVLYDALLAEGLSLERALLRVRAALHSPNGRAAPGGAGDALGPRSEDAYALQLYARSTEQVRAADGSPAWRPVVASYPFSRAAPEEPAPDRRRGEAPFFVPFPRNPGFVGRSAELAQLHRVLQEGDARSARPVMLTGMGGVGKTQLAVEHAHAFRGSYPGGIYWINAAGGDIRAEIAKLAVAMGQSAGEGAASEQQLRLVAAFQAALGSRPRALVVFDNVEEPRDLDSDAKAGFVPSNLGCAVMFTTRRRDDSYRVVEVGVLAEEAAAELLLSARRRAPAPVAGGPEERAAARVICEALGRLPLALALAAAYLGKYDDIALADYLERIRTEGALLTVDDAEVEARHLATRHTAAVGATLALQWDALSEPEARATLKTAALLGEAAAIPRARLSLLTGLADRAQRGRPAPLTRALKALHHLSMIEELTADTFRVHPLVREFAAARTEGREAFAAACAERMEATLGDMARLPEQAAARGIDAVLEDLRAGAALGGPASGRLAAWMRPLDREAHCLRGWVPDQNPGFFLQQLRNRCLELGFEEARQRAEAELEKQGFPFLRERFRTSRESPALVRTLEGHIDIASAVAVTPDGRLAVSASRDRTLKVWDLGSGQVLRTLEGHAAWVVRAAVTSDGRRVVSASEDGVLKVWDLATGEVLHTLEGHPHPGVGLAVTPDGRFLLSNGRDQGIQLWDLSTGQVARTIGGEFVSVYGFTVTPDGRFALVAARGHACLHVYELATGQLARVIEGYSGSQHCLAVTPDGRLAINGTSEGVVRSWDLATGQVVHRLEGHTGPVTAVTVTPDGRFALSASKDGTVRRWDLRSGQAARTYLGHSGHVHGVAVTPDGRFALSASADLTLKVWDLASEEVAAAPAGHSGGARGVAVTPDGRFAVSAAPLSDAARSRCDGLKVWDLATGQVARTLTHRRLASFYCVAVAPDGRFALSGSVDDTLAVWDLSTGKPVRVMKGHGGMVADVAVTPDGRLALSASYDKTVRVWDLSTGQAVQTMEGHASNVHGVAVTPDGRLALSASIDGKVLVWDLSTGRVVRALVHTDYVHKVAVTPDGRFALSASADKTVRQWDLSTGACVHTFVGHTDIVTGVAISPDGRCAVSTSLDCSLRVWDLAARRLVAVLETHAPLFRCAITPDGRTLVAVDGLGGVHFVDRVEPGPGASG